jgi:hypothetical protein
MARLRREPRVDHHTTQHSRSAVVCIQRTSERTAPLTCADESARAKSFNYVELLHEHVVLPHSLCNNEQTRCNSRWEALQIKACGFEKSVVKMEYDKRSLKGKAEEGVERLRSERGVKGENGGR